MSVRWSSLFLLSLAGSVAFFTCGNTERGIGNPPPSTPILDPVVRSGGCSDCKVHVYGPTKLVAQLKTQAQMQTPVPLQYSSAILTIKGLSKAGVENTWVRELSTTLEWKTGNSVVADVNLAGVDADWAKVKVTLQLTSVPAILMDPDVVAISTALWINPTEPGYAP